MCRSFWEEYWGPCLIARVYRKAPSSIQYTSNDMTLWHYYIYKADIQKQTISFSQHMKTEKKRKEKKTRLHSDASATLSNNTAKDTPESPSVRRDKPPLQTPL